jgi:hypothetical protein
VPLANARVFPGRSPLPSAQHRLGNTQDVDADDRPPICPSRGVTMVPGVLSADENHDADWVCLECEELGEEK